jgi:UDP-3-O-acyl N-acetylglucosamine deacetylase
MILTPLPPNHGIIFKDITTGVTFPARVAAVTSTDFCTSLASGSVTARTVEHLLSALHAYGVTNVLITLDGEVPIMDGSAAAFCELLETGRIVEQQEETEEFVVEQRYCVGEIQGDAKYLSLEPYDGLRVTYRLEYPPPLGVQEFTYEHHDGRSYWREIAPARTFAFVPDVEKMHEQGLIPGGRLNNVVLIDDGKIINHTPLRFADECVRHKVLDLLGDLYLLGKGLRGHVRAYKTGHTENIALVKQLAALSERP